MIGTRDGLTFEVDHCGEGEELALCYTAFRAQFFLALQLPMLADLGFTAWAPNLRVTATAFVRRRASLPR